MARALHKGVRCPRRHRCAGESHPPRRHKELPLAQRILGALQQGAFLSTDSSLHLGAIGVPVNEAAPG